MKRNICPALLIISLICAARLSLFAQQTTKLPSKIGDGFVLRYDAPFDRILIDTDEKDVPNRLASEIFITPRTKLLNYKGKPTEPGAIRPGMKVEIKLESNSNNLTASQIKLRTNPEDWEMEVDGYLDKTDAERGFIDGQAVALAPNVLLKGTKDWKGKTFASFKEVPLGSLLDLKGTRSAGGVILVKEGEVEPNKFTADERQLVEAVQKGLVVPPPDKQGAGVQIGNRAYKLSENLELNSYVNKVGNRVAPRYLKKLPPDDPNNILFRFYVLEDDAPNAFAFPDGSVFINTGLLKRLENEAQIAVVIGHEIAHVTNEHSRRMVETARNNAMWAGLIGAAASAALGRQGGLLVARLGYNLMSNKFSRDLEDQADRVGLYYAWEAGYDVREAPQMWRGMMGDYRESQTVLYSDHPSLLSRYRNTNRMMAFNYAASDFSEAETGRERFMETVGVFFGWVEPKPKPTIIIPQPDYTRIEPPPKPTKPNKTTTTKMPKKITAQTKKPVVKKQTTAINSKIPMDLLKQLATNDENKSVINDSYGGDVQKFADSLSVTPVDLNKDGRLEYIIVVPALCGASDCPASVYQKASRNGYKLLLEEYNIKPKLTVSGNYRDLQASSQAGVDDVRTAVYKFIGGKYVLSGCIRTITDRSGNRPIITQEKCN